MIFSIEPSVITTTQAETTIAPTTAATTTPPSTASQPQTNPMLQTQGQNCKQTCLYKIVISGCSQVTIFVV